MPFLIFRRRCGESLGVRPSVPPKSRQRRFLLPNDDSVGLVGKRRNRTRSKFVNGTLRSTNQCEPAGPLHKPLGTLMCAEHSPPKSPKSLTAQDWPVCPPQNFGCHDSELQNRCSQYVLYAQRTGWPKRSDPISSAPAVPAVLHFRRSRV